MIRYRLNLTYYKAFYLKNNNTNSDGLVICFFGNKACRTINRVQRPM